MANDVIFKTKAFGGFKKDEVMNYINNLISEKDALEQKCKALTEEKENLTKEKEESIKKSKELEERFEQLMQEREAEAKLLLEEKTLREAVNTEKEELSIKYLKLSNEFTELKNTPVLSEEDAELLKVENARLKLECDKLKAMEQQVGAAMLDARLRSEELIKEAEEKASLVRKDVYDAIGDTALKIDELSGSISEITRSFTKAVGEVEMRIGLLTGNMSKTAQALISNNLEAAPKIQGVVEDTTYSEIVSNVEQSILDSVSEAEEELENTKESLVGAEVKHKVVIKAKHVEVE